MAYTVEEIKTSIAYCGLVCALCNEAKSGKCKGCRNKCDDCTVKACAKSKKLEGCFECKEFPCNENMLSGKRNRVFLQCAKDEGLEKLAEYLKNNYDNGIQYHKEDGTRGDYDVLATEAEISDLLRA